MIHRAEHDSDFTQIDNALLRDTSLSEGARSLLFYMLSMSDEWTFSVKALAIQFRVKPSTIHVRISELKHKGYIKMQSERGNEGRFSSCTWDVFEKAPRSEFTELGDNRVRSKPCSVKTAFGDNRVRSNGNIKNINIKEHQDIKNIKGKEEKAAPFARLLEPLSPDVREVFENFIQMRKTIKAPMTEKALDLAIKKAFKLADNDPDTVKAIVEQSILNSWRGLFALKDNVKHCAPPDNEEEIDWDEMARELEEKHRREGTA